MTSKIYVDILVMFEAKGMMLPQALTWIDGTVYEIDRILDIRPAVSTKAGGAGLRYTVRILGKERYLFYERFENTPRWFVEGK